MLTKAKLNKIIKDAAEKIGYDIDIFNLKGKLVCTSRHGYNPSLIDTNIANRRFDLDKDMVVYDNKTYQRLSAGGKRALFIQLDNCSEEVQNYAYFIKGIIEANLKSANTKLAKKSVFKKIILGQMNPIELYGYLKEYNLKAEIKRCILIIRLVSRNENIGLIKEMLVKAFAQNSNDFIVSISDDMFVLIKTFNDEGASNEEMLEVGEAIVSSILNETFIKSSVGIGRIKDNIKDLSASYQEAQLALNIGTIFSRDKDVFAYEQLALERLLYGLDLEKCLSFYNEVFGKEKDKLLNEEMYLTIEKFFQNSLNLSETSRQLYIHRNTLVYRLDKIQKITGLDLRNFDDAVTFKLIMMINNYIKYKEDKK